MVINHSVFNMEQTRMFQSQRNGSRRQNALMPKISVREETQPAVRRVKEPSPKKTDVVSSTSGSTSSGAVSGGAFGFLNDALNTFLEKVKQIHHNANQNVPPDEVGTIKVGGTEHTLCSADSLKYEESVYVKVNEALREFYDAHWIISFSSFTKSNDAYNQAVANGTATPEMKERFMDEHHARMDAVQRVNVRFFHANREVLEKVGLDSLLKGENGIEANREVLEDEELKAADEKLLVTFVWDFEATRNKILEYTMGMLFDSTV